MNRQNSSGPGGVILPAEVCRRLPYNRSFETPFPRGRCHDDGRRARRRQRSPMQWFSHRTVPIYYDIFPELKLILYVCGGPITPNGFFQVGDEVARDPRLLAGMNVSLDFFDAQLETSSSDLKLAAAKYAEARQREITLGRTAVLTASTTLKHLANALRALSQGAIEDFGVFHTQLDAVRWLGLPETETLARWAETRQKFQRYIPR